MTIRIHFLLSLMMLVLPNLYGITNVKLASSRCVSLQKDLLLQLKNNLTYNPSISKKLVSWDHRIDCCSWEGVDCDHAGHVIGLDLSNESISGQLDDSSSLFGLQFLQSLSLAQNGFNEVLLPTGFGKLKELVHLNLSEAGFAGQIPIDFSELSRLVSLDLSYSSPTYLYLLKLENPNLNMLVQNLTKLRELRLDGVDIAAVGGDWCQALSSSLPNLHVLSLSYCNLSGPLGSSLAKLLSLSVVKLDGNNFSAPFPEFFAEFSNLTVLSAKECNFLGEAPKEIFQKLILRTIDLSINLGLGGSVPEFTENGSLENLDLTFTNFSGNLPDSIGNLRMLSTLKLSRCNFSGPIPSSISNLSHLVSIDLSSNNFTGSLPSFTRSRNLTSIDLRGNNLREKIPPAWEVLQKLSYLDLNHNFLGGDLPAFLFSLPSLHSLKLSNNQFSGLISELEHVSPSPMTYLDLSSNNFEGPIPQFLFKMSGLKTLSLSWNNFSGTIELSKFSELENLDFLDLSHNGVSVGTSGSDSTFSLLPQFDYLNLASCQLQKFPFLKNQSRLGQLGLSENQITGEIPNWLWKIGDGQLRSVNLSYNQLTGLQEPYHFQNLAFLDLHSNLLAGGVPLPPRSATYVDFSTNRFTSSIPADVGNHLTSARYLSVANNSIVGDIPISICNASVLEVLDLSGNSLNGSIPSCLVEKSGSLRVLDLHGNKLSGKIPDTFTEVCDLDTLELSDNQLGGQFPESLVKCKNLMVLNLGHNRISSTFPCILEKLSHLSVLILHFNKFHGEINCRAIIWPKLQMIDLASNNFSGAFPMKFLSSLSALLDEYKSNMPLQHLDSGFIYGASYHDQMLVTLESYYGDRVRMNYKGQWMELPKLFTTYNSIDFSSNNFRGSIPETIESLRSLRFLNLSNNALTGQIPSSFGNLKNLESLDLASNKLNGKIPQQLTSLTLLTFLNLSNNQLVGRIPVGGQLQTFPAGYQGNEGLCGIPLNRFCNANISPELQQPTAAEDEQSYSNTEIYTSAAIGFLVGLGVIFVPLWLSNSCRICYNKHVDHLISWIFGTRKKNWGRT